MLQKNYQIRGSIAFLLANLSFCAGASPNNNLPTSLPKIVGSNEICAGGECTILSTDQHYPNTKIQWFKNGEKIEGASNETLKHTSGETTNKKTTYTYTIVNEGDTVVSQPFEVTDVACCTTADGTPASRKLIWQEDFGTFTSRQDYWTWDYSDISKPTKVYHSNGDNWSYGLDQDPEGAAYKAMPMGEGTYSVAANVTCTWDDLSAKQGTNWEWQAFFGNGRRPGENGWTFVPDHTYGGTEYGAMLFINCGNEPDGVIYTKEISNIHDSLLIAKCYVNTFSRSVNPVKVYLRLTDLASGQVHESPVVTRYANEYSGLGWREVSLPITFTGNAARLDVVSYAGGKDYNKDGNDLVIDDIQLWGLGKRTVTKIELTEASSNKSKVSVFTPLGVRVKDNIDRKEAAEGLKPGIYIIGNEKIIVR